MQKEVMWSKMWILVRDLSYICHQFAGDDMHYMEHEVIDFNKFLIDCRAENNLSLDMTWTTKTQPSE